MLRRQQSSLSSSRRQVTTTPPPSETQHVVKSMGCMSGIFQLFSKYQNSNKRLTFGRKQEKCKPSSPRKAKEEIFLDSKRLSCNISARSPTVRPEIRRSNAVNSESPTTPSSLVKRLMGLEDVTVKRFDNNEASPSSSGEKRREMLRAVQKCNEDLEELKRIILALKSSSDDVRLQSAPQLVVAKITSTENCTDVGAVQELSPVSVLDEFTRSKLQSSSSIQGSTRVPLQSSRPLLAKKPIKDDEPIAKYLFLSNFSTATISILIQTKRQVAAASPPWRSRAMVQSVEEVCSDIIWGENREIRRIGLVLQDNLCKDLVEELVQELKSFCICYSLPLQGCKRKLCF